jgi:hypothetical protein
MLVISSTGSPFRVQVAMKFVRPYDFPDLHLCEFVRLRFGNDPPGNGLQPPKCFYLLCKTQPAPLFAFSALARRPCA